MGLLGNRVREATELGRLDSLIMVLSSNGRDYVPEHHDYFDQESAGCNPSSRGGRRRTISRAGRPSSFARAWNALPER